MSIYFSLALTSALFLFLHHSSHLVVTFFGLEVRTPPYPKAESLSSLCALILYLWLYTHALRHNTFHGFSDTATAYKGLALLLALVHVGR